VFFQHEHSEEEHFLANIEIRYNRLLFRNGVFLDSVMRNHGYGVAVMCHALPALTQHVENEAHDARVFLFLNWRQCRTKLKNYIISHMSKLHATTDALRDNCLAAPPREHAEASLEQSDDKNTTSTDSMQVAPAISGRSVWEQKMFLSLRKSVYKTFNLQ